MISEATVGRIAYMVFHVVWNRKNHRFSICVMLIRNAVCVDRIISSNRCHVVKLPSHKAITLLLILFLFTFYPRSFFLLYSALNGTLSKADVRKIDALDQWCLRRILDIRWYHRVSNWEARRLTEQPPYFDHTEKETHAVWPPDQNG